MALCITLLIRNKLSFLVLTQMLSYYFLIHDVYNKATQLNEVQYRYRLCISSNRPIVSAFIAHQSIR